MFGGLGNLLGSWGTIPDIIMGKKPKDALLDNLRAAAIVGTGMYVAPSVLGSGSGSLLGGSSAAPASTGYGSSLLGASTPATQTAAPIADTLTKSASLFDKANVASGGWMDKGLTAVDKFGKIANPVMQGMQVAQSMTPEETPPPPPPQLNNAPLNLADVIAQGNMQQQYDLQEQMRRKQLMQNYINNIGRA